jgi:hypothetical protein
MSLACVNSLIDWKVDQVLEIKALRQKGEHTMQYQFTIEVRVDFEDTGKLEQMKSGVAYAGRHVLAIGRLLADKTQPSIAMFSDDFFNGAEQIDLLHDIIQQGKDIPVAADVADSSISQEMIDAMK